MENSETVRERALARLKAKESEANLMSNDRFWMDGPYNVQQWAARGFYCAIRIVKETAPAAGETPADYLDRVAAEVHSYRDRGPDADLESWFASAIDEACMIIRGARAE